MAFTSVLNASYPDVLLEWAPTTKPTDAAQTWVDITSRLRDWEWGYGRNDELARFEAGNGYVLLNNSDRALDPTLNAGAWYGNIKPRKMFRLRYRYNSVTYPGFVAYSRGFPQAWPASGYDSVVKVDLVDAFAVLQGFDLVTGFTRGVESSDARITAILDAVGVPAALRDLDVGTVDVAALAVTASGTSALDHAKAVAEAEFGALFTAKDGKVTFHNRWRRLNQTSAHTFTDNPAAGGLRYSPDLAAAFDETYLWNYLRVSGPGVDDVPATSTDAASDLDYHTIVRDISSPLATFNDRQALADYEIDLYAQPQLRAPALPLNGARDASVMWPVILDLEISDQITVNRFATAGDPMSFIQNVEGIRHSCKPGGPWLTSVATSPADTNAYWQLQVAGKSELNNTTGVAA